MNNKTKKPDKRTLQILEALSLLGGYGELKDIYRVMDFSEWGTKFPHDTVRQKLQYGRGELFFNIDRGVWCNKSYMMQQKQIQQAVGKLNERVSAVENTKPVVKIYAEHIEYKTNNNTVVQNADEDKPELKDTNVQKKPAPQKSKTLKDYILIASLREPIWKLLTEYLKDKRGKDATMVILAAIEAGAIKRPPYSVFNNEYKKVINYNHYYEYLKSRASYPADTFGTIVQAFRDIIESRPME